MRIWTAVILGMGMVLAAAPASQVRGDLGQPLLAFVDAGEILFEVWPEDIRSYGPTRARRGPPMLSIRLKPHRADAYISFIERNAGRMVQVETCGEFLSERRLMMGRWPEQIELLFMEDDRSRAYVAMLGEGGCR